MTTGKIVRISPVATRSDHRYLTVVDTNLISQKARDASKNNRKREIHNFHAGDDDSLQRMLNALQPGSYIRPHRHRYPPRAESIILLQGAIGYVPFNEDGVIQEEDLVLLDLNRGFYGLDSRSGLWHTFFALKPDTVIFEVKPGPYAPSTDKDFATWSPSEGSTDATEYLMRLEDNFRTIFQLPPRSWGKK